MPYEVICIIEAAIILILLIAVIVLVIKNRKPKDKADNVKIKDGVRYTKTTAAFSEDGSVAITHREGDAVLERGKTYTAVKDGYVMPGKYTVLSSEEGTDKFNVRLGGFVRQLSHGTEIVLAEGDEITPVSTNIVLR
ncbi:MAG: hypothetical protein J6Y68_02555 [Clostridia bacterium]|nr:hypothetical protein [Clostridia bacterium]